MCLKGFWLNLLVGPVSRKSRNVSAPFSGVTICSLSKNGSNMGIICGPGIICGTVWGSFADQYSFNLFEI